MKYLVTFVLLIIGSAGADMAMPTGDYKCTPSQVLQFDATGTSFGVAAVLSTDAVFTLHPPRADSTLVYQHAGTTWLIDEIEDGWAKFKYRVVYSGDLRSFTGYCQPVS